MRQAQNRDQWISSVKSIFLVLQVDDFELGLSTGLYVNPVEYVSASVLQRGVCHGQTMLPKPAISVPPFAMRCGEVSMCRIGIPDGPEERYMGWPLLLIGGNPGEHFFACNG